MRPFPLAFAAGLVLAGCGGDGVSEVLAPPPGPAAATLTEIQDTIFTPRCAFDGCHAGPAPQQGMDLSPGVARLSIVGVPSAELSTLDRVRPGDAANSYLWMKVAGDARIVGERMPFGGPYLSDGEIERVRSWIAAGAPDD